MSVVKSVHQSSGHAFSKVTVPVIEVIEGYGVSGDAHSGVSVKHRSRVKVDPDQPNLRQVHLIHDELFDELRTKGFNIKAGDIGENITTSGIDLLSLPRATQLKIGQSVVLEVTGLRNPCAQLDQFRKGLMAAVLDRDVEGNLVRKSGIMSIVLKGGFVQAGDKIEIKFPRTPYRSLDKV